MQKLKSMRFRAEEDLERFHFRFLRLFGYGMAGSAFGLLIALIISGFKEPQLSDWYMSIILGTVLGLLVYIVTTEVIRVRSLRDLRWIDYKLAQLGVEELQETIEEDFFTKLVKINFKYIDKYYSQTQEQADKSFRVSVIAGIIGLVVLVGGIISMFIIPEQSVAAVVTTAAGVLGEFIAAVFFYLYNQTIMKMSQYHQKLVITQNISLALKISDGLGAVEKARAMELLIDRLTVDVNKYLVDNKD
jgi:hypothetical protein